MQLNVMHHSFFWTTFTFQIGTVGLYCRQILDLVKVTLE